MKSFLLLFATVVASTLADSCQDGYQLVQGGKCVKLVKYTVAPLTKLIPETTAICDADGATLPIIKSAEDNAIVAKVMNTLDVLKDDTGVWIVLGLFCDAKGTRRWKWQDKTSVTYVPEPKIDFKNIDCVDAGKDVVIKKTNNAWQLVSDNQTYYQFTTICVAEPRETTIDETCGEYEAIQDSADADKPCYKIYSDLVSWADAEQTCIDDDGYLATIHNEKENTYFRRAATGLGLIGAMHIGAYRDDSDSSDWKWIDGDEAVDYDNFRLVAGGGERAAMQLDTNGKWVNVDGESDKLVFLCRRPSNPMSGEDCPSDIPLQNTDIFPPGFPNSSIECEYTLSATEANKRIQLKVLNLEAVENVDYLYVYEGFSGVPICNMTGYQKDVICETKEKPVMRVSWKPKSGQVRGFRMKYTEIDN